jgi:DNA-binding NtrC family response regulator
LHRILVADDEEASRQGLKTLLTRWGYEVQDAANGKEALQKAGPFRPDVVITDLVMPEFDGLELLKSLHEELAFTTVIVLTGHGSIETAVSAMKQGAYDYLTKPVDVARLKVMIEKALEKGATLREMTILRRRLKDVWGLGKIVGKSKPMQEVYRLIELVAPTTANVFILGESGTGKELVAQSCHALSPRSQGPFVPVNCSAIPETLLESEIFGHEKGAFTGALERRIGCFEMAHQGTIFLDEVAEMSPTIQAKFLRILQDGTVRRVGGTSEIKVDVRVLAATNKDPLKAIQDGSLREDLYYRLQVCTLTLPALRERKDDIPLLIQAFIEEFNAKYDRKVKSIDDAALRGLLDASWPGNVRELRNTIERAVIICDADLITPKHVSQLVATEKVSDNSSSVSFDVGTTIDEAEKRLILKTLASTSNNKTRAAEILGISLKTLHNKLHRYGVQDAPQH